MAMTQKVLRGALFGALFIYVIIVLAAAIDKHDHQFYIGADQEVDLAAGNISALQVDEPNHAEDSKPVEASSEVPAHTHSHVHSTTATKDGDTAAASFCAGVPVICTL